MAIATGGAMQSKLQLGTPARTAEPWGIRERMLVGQAHCARMRLLRRQQEDERTRSNEVVAMQVDPGRTLGDTDARLRRKFDIGRFLASTAQSKRMPSALFLISDHSASETTLRPRFS